MNFSSLTALKCNLVTPGLIFLFLFSPCSYREPFKHPSRHLLGICIHNHPPCSVALTASVVSEKVLNRTVPWETWETRKLTKYVQKFAFGEGGMQITVIILLSSANGFTKSHSDQSNLRSLMKWFSYFHTWNRIWGLTLAFCLAVLLRQYIWASNCSSSTYWFIWCFSTAVTIPRMWYIYIYFFFLEIWAFWPLGLHLILW